MDTRQRLQQTHHASLPVGRAQARFSGDNHSGQGRAACGLPSEPAAVPHEVCGRGAALTPAPWPGMQGHLGDGTQHRTAPARIRLGAPSGALHNIHHRKGQSALARQLKCWARRYGTSFLLGLTHDRSFALQLLHKPGLLERLCKLDCGLHATIPTVTSCQTASRPAGGVVGLHCGDPSYCTCSAWLSGEKKHARPHPCHKYVCALCRVQLICCNGARAPAEHDVTALARPQDGASQ